MSLVRINEGEKIMYRGVELKQHFEKVNRKRLTELGKKIYNQILKKLDYNLDKDLMNVFITEYVPVTKGYCPGVTRKLKAFNQEIRTPKEIENYLNNIQYRYGGNESYFEISIR